MIATLSAETLRAPNTKAPLVRIHPKYQLRFSGEAVRLLGLKIGMKLSFYIDTEKPDFVYFCEDEKGITLQCQKKTPTGVSGVVCCRPLPLRILKHFNSTQALSIRLDNRTVLVNGKRCWVIDKAELHQTKYNI